MVKAERGGRQRRNRQTALQNFRPRELEACPLYAMECGWNRRALYFSAALRYPTGSTADPDYRYLFYPFASLMANRIQMKVIQMNNWKVHIEPVLLYVQLEYMWESRFIWSWCFEVWHIILFPGLYPELLQDEIYQSFRRALFWWMLNGGRSSQCPPIPPEIIEHERNFKPE